MNEPMPMSKPMHLDKPLRGRIYDNIGETIGNTPFGAGTPASWPRPTSRPRSF